MKHLFSVVIALAAILIFAPQEAKAQYPISEITIGNTNSAYFKGQQAVSPCTNPPAYFAKPFFGQGSNSGQAHYLNGVQGEYTYIALIYDQWGNPVMVGAPGSGYPQNASWPSGDQVDFNYLGCSHPTVINIY